jgi:hypothetical protein
MDNTELVASSSPSFSAYKITNITFEKITYYGYEVIPTEENEMLYSLEIYYDEGSKGLIHRSYGTASELPLTFDPQERKCYYELPAEGATIMLWNEHSLTRYEGWGRGDDDRELLASLHVVPDGSLIKTFDADGIKATIKYEPSSWIAADIHWGMERTYDFYKEVFDRNSYDDQGAPIINLFYLPNEFEKDSYFFTSIAGNAFALDVTPHPMVFCPGDDALMSEVVELSVMAHEFTHLITSCTAGLVNEGESGALNESFSDIMGINVKKYFLGNDASWKIGEGVNLEGDNVRDMAFPENSGDGDYDSCPDTYCGEFWFPTGLVPDGGGVHTNCGVQNKWYYLLTDGDSGTNDNDYTYDVTGIGIEKSRQIAYLTLTEYATEEAEYPDIRLCSHQAAQMLFGEDSVEANTVLEAWDAVGVTEDCDDDDWLSIETVSPEPTVRHNYYDLQGRRVMQPESGFYVKDGHKIIVK